MLYFLFDIRTMKTLKFYKEYIQLYIGKETIKFFHKTFLDVIKR